MANDVVMLVRTPADEFLVCTARGRYELYSSKALIASVDDVDALVAAIRLLGGAATEVARVL